MNEKERTVSRITIILLLIMCLFEGACIGLGVDILNDKTAYINGLQSDKSICKGKLEEIMGDYAKLDKELREYKRVYGDIDE